VHSDIGQLLSILQQYQSGTLTVAAAADRIMPLVKDHGGRVPPNAKALLANVPDPRLRELLAELERRLEADLPGPPA
jgi:hypothetical protein